MNSDDYVYADMKASEKGSKKPTDKPFVVKDTYAYKNSFNGVREHTEFFVQRSEDKRFRLVGVNAGSPDLNIPSPPTRIPYNLDKIKNENPEFIIITEGEKDSDTLNKNLRDFKDFNAVATTFPFGAKAFKRSWEWREFWIDSFKNKTIVVFGDEDPAGREYVKTIMDKLPEEVDDVIAPKLPDMRMNMDITDWLKSHTIDDLKVAINKEQDISFPSVSNFLKEEHQERGWVVDGVIPFGVTMMNAQPKVGKSQLCLSLANSVVDGDEWSGRKVAQSSVMYVALEGSSFDWENRLKDLNIELSDNFGFWRTSFSPDIFIQVKRMMKKKNCKLLIVDTIGHFDNQILSSPKKGTDYQIQIKQMERYIKLSEDLNCGVVLIHHEYRGDDRAVRNSGMNSSGMNASADNIIKLSKKDGVRYLESEGRVAEHNIPKTELKKDSIRGLIYLGDEASTSEVKDLTQEVKDFIEETKPVEHKEVIKAVTGRTESIGQALNYLLENNEIILENERPKIYSIPIPSPMGGTGNETPDTQIITEEAKEINDNTSEIHESWNTIS